MNWLNPTLLWSLTALAIPLIIHFLSRNRTKEIAFGSIRFLKESSTIKSRKIQISEVPLLLLRMLIVIFVVMLMAELVIMQEVNAPKAILLGEDIKRPEAYKSDEIKIFNTSEFKETANHWDYLNEISHRHPEIDTLIYFNEFTQTDFTGAIPKLNFHVELMPTSLISRAEKKLVQDTLLIHFDNLSKTRSAKFDKLLKANQLYTNNAIRFKAVRKEDAQLVFSNSVQKDKVNQIVVNNRQSEDYATYIKSNYMHLYLNEEWVANPLNEDMFLSVVSEFIAQIIEPNYQYSSFEELYMRKSDATALVKKARSFADELLLLILISLVLERYLTYRKNHA